MDSVQKVWSSAVLFFCACTVSDFAWKMGHGKKNLLLNRDPKFNIWTFFFEFWHFLGKKIACPTYWQKNTVGIPVGSPAAPKLCNVCRYPFSLAQNEQRIQKSVTAILSTALQSPDFFFVLLLHRIICYWLKREGSFKKTGVQVGHKSAEGIPSYIFKTKIIPKLSRIRWDTPTEKNHRIQTVGSGPQYR